MLKLLTGQPGNGKTLWVLDHVERQRKKESRPVFYSGIPLNPEGPLVGEWQELGDITKLVESYVGADGAPAVRYTLPANAIVVMDEAQRVFRVRAQGSKVPDHVAAMETHRHQGIDFWLLSQNPGLIDVNLRKLAGYHVHVVRRAGLDRTNVYEWEQCETDPMRDASKKSARHSVWKFPTEVYTWYKSAEVHTHKRNLPWKQIAGLGVALVVVLGSAGYTAWHVMHGAGVAALPKAQEGEEPVVGGKRAKAVELGNPWDAQLRRPRIEGWERTAAVFDPLQRVKSQPKVAGCMELRVNETVTCECFTSQGSLLPMNRHDCARLMRQGWFDETAPESSAKQENIRRLNARDDSGREGPPQADPAAPAS